MCANCDCKCRPGRPERGCGCKCKSCSAARESVGKRLFRGKLIARKTAEVTAANADEVRRAFAAGVLDAEAAALRVTDRAERGVRRGALAGGAALAGGLTVPVVVNHVMAGRRERKRVAKGFSGYSGIPTMGNQMSERGYLLGGSASLAELSKAWKGEPGDKRNTKYASAALVGSVVPGIGTAAGPVGYAFYRHLNEDGKRRRKMSVAERKRILAEERREHEAKVGKAMSPGKLLALRSAANRGTSGASAQVRRDGDYARNRLSAYRVGASSPVGSAAPGVQASFRSAATSSASRSKYAAANAGEGRKLYSPVPMMGNRAYDQSIAARRIRMGNAFRDRPRLP